MKTTHFAAASSFLLSTAIALSCDRGVDTQPRNDEGVYDAYLGKDAGDDHGDEGCVLTQGYWKNHPEAWPVEDTLCDQDWLDILWTPPQNGDAWYILAHQWIAAQLNVESGAVPSPEVDDMLADAEGLLLSCTFDTSDRDAAIALSENLDDFNNGQLDVPHCDDEEDDEDDCDEDEEDDCDEDDEDDCDEHEDDCDEDEDDEDECDDPDDEDECDEHDDKDEDDCEDD